ncbi:MAG: Rrf2 family transcriptional regulator [Verrucomicrobiaceae bacterium]|nr:Rrf2 family transcriptional regulator [Verrucomicrobiaceae bacterium]
MKLSKKAEYALRALVAMGRGAVGRTFSIQEIATGEHIPLKFLEQILLQLKNGGILRSKRGVGGGYQLARPASRIKLAEVIATVDGPAEMISCVTHVGAGTACECGVAGGCALGHTFAQLRDQIDQWLNACTIAQIIEREGERSGMAFDI